MSARWFDVRSAELAGFLTVAFTETISEERWGRLTRFRLPGGSDVGLYEPRHPRATEL